MSSVGSCPPLPHRTPFVPLTTRHLSHRALHASLSPLLPSQGVWTRIRLAVADHTGVSAAVTLACLNSSGTGCCEARQVARDSMYLSSLPGPSATSWTLSSVGRLDLAVKCSAPGALAWNGGAIALATVGPPLLAPRHPTCTCASTLALACRKASMSVDPSCLYNVHALIPAPPSLPLSLFPSPSLAPQTSAAADTSAALASPYLGATGTWSPALPSYRGNLRTAVVPNANKLSLQITPTSIITTNGAGAAPVTNTWDAAVPALGLVYGETYEAVLVSPNHPLHLHIYPMQVGSRALW